MATILKTNSKSKVGDKVIGIVGKPVDDSVVLENNTWFFKYLIKKDDFVIIGCINKETGAVDVIEISSEEYELVKNML